MAAGSGKRFLDEVDDDRIVAAIQAAEEPTTGQIRVHLSGRKSRKVEPAARKTFARLGMSNTPGRNAVLLYLQPWSHKLFVMGDSGFDAIGGAALWQPVAEALSIELAAGRITEGLVGAIERIGAILREHFPADPAAPPAPGLPDEPTRD